MQRSTGLGSAGGRAAARGALGLVLYFARGARPSLARLEEQGREQAFTVTPAPASPQEAAEVMLAGFFHALIGLAPGPGARVSAPGAAYDLVLPALAATEAVRVLPAETLSGAAARPARRTLVDLGCRLDSLPGLVALGWEAAETAMSPIYYGRVMRAWLAGGAFPGLGLTALHREGAAVRSQGLEPFTGYELAVTDRAGGSPAGAARLALRAMDLLVEHAVPPDDLIASLGLAPVSGAFSADGALFTVG